MKKLICLIEGDASFARNIQLRLTNLGYEVIYYTSGEDYLDHHDTGMEALFLIGMNLPGMNGKELVHRIRLTSRLVPIHIISPESHAHLIIQGLKAGADGFLIKPIDMGEFFARMEVAWERFIMLMQLRLSRSGGTSL